MTKVLFVCLGNICRSPTAQVVFAQKATQAGLSVEVDSAGTGAWHLDEPPYGAMMKAANARGYDLSELRARQVSVEDFARFDLIVVMDCDNQSDMEALRPDGDTTPIKRFTDFGDPRGLNHVPDPYVTREFDVAIDVIEDASDGLILALSA